MSETLVDTPKLQEPKVHQGTLNLKPYEWGPGQSGNPKGRPKGSRTKLAEDFLRVLYEDFQEHGLKAVQDVRKDKPEVYLKIVADLIPRNVKVDVTLPTKIAHIIVDTKAIDNKEDTPLPDTIEPLQVIDITEDISEGGGTVK